VLNCEGKEEHTVGLVVTERFREEWQLAKIDVLSFISQKRKRE